MKTVSRLARTCQGLFFCASWIASGALAQETKPATPENVTPPVVEEKETAYDARLERLAEILGAVHYLRNLCVKEGEDAWRRSMERLIELETHEQPKRKERLTASFNRGYRSFASVYTTCTRPAVVAEEKYRNEGATLASEITARFGN
ncbi:TIGR02301 family protein [Sinorhizobium sp. BG8]|uniref:TIGR02301 family protein n=1 Tax=Sinorhizobium sp. BG8 TaxID=2613773 RepID=UPI00193DD06C|nr:TIGR02301 family protein [Sinorhizobium sp. BG8]QRM54842.1 TIGR02301 family protein [Sinorhizobium sp. BG8]